MATAASLLNRIEALEKGQGLQKTKIFFIDGGSDESLIKAQWEAVKSWENVHPWGRAYVIVFEEVGPE